MRIYIFHTKNRQGKQKGFAGQYMLPWRWTPVRGETIEIKCSFYFYGWTTVVTLKTEGWTWSYLANPKSWFVVQASGQICLAILFVFWSVFWHFAAREVRLTHQVIALRRDHAEFNRSLVSENRKGIVSQCGLESLAFFFRLLQNQTDWVRLPELFHKPSYFILKS